MLHTKNFGLLEFALQLEPTAVGLRAAAGARAQSSFLSETRGSQISPPIRTGRDDERSPAIGVQHRPEHRLTTSAWLASLLASCGPMGHNKLDPFSIF